MWTESLLLLLFIAQSMNWMIEVMKVYALNQDNLIVIFKY